jgi:hypothetical protein
MFLLFWPSITSWSLVRNSEMKFLQSMLDQGTPKFERNQINDPLRIKSAHFEIT